MPEIDLSAIFVIVFVVLAVVMTFMGVNAVQQGMEFTTERFGRYTRTLKPGINFIMPIIDRIGSRVNMRETVMDVPSQ